MQILPYDPQVFTSLSDFFDARDDLADLQAGIDSLGAVITAHGLHDAVGVTLLHKHFDLAPDEIVVRRFQDDRLATMTAEREDSAGLFPYVWRLAEGGGGRGFYPLEFCATTERRDARSARAQLAHLGGASAFLDDFAAALERRGLVQAFGLSGLHAREPFRLAAGDTLLELSNERDRILTLEKRSQAFVRGVGGTTQTLWVFRPDAEAAAAATCASHCYGHCNGHAGRALARGKP